MPAATTAVNRRRRHGQAAARLLSGDDFDLNGTGCRLQNGGGVSYLQPQSWLHQCR
ncbi:FAD-dependent oxidoreductase [Sesbania bispinosa]|nr:FAD-dependent oxidoreductase [Sesbania bispinosa]